MRTRLRSSLVAVAALMVGAAAAEHHHGAADAPMMMNEDSTADGGHRGMMAMPQGMGDMMGQGRGMDMMGQGQGMMMAPASGEPAAALTIDQVRQRMAAMMRGAGHGMRLGKVTALDDDLADVEVLDQAGAPAGRVIVNRHGGAIMRVR